MPKGRPTRRTRDGLPAGLKLDDDRAKKIIGFLRSGASQAAAAEAAGIDKATFYRWLQRGEGAGAAKVYRDFAESVRTAEAEFEVAHTGLMSQSARGGAIIEERTITRRDGTTVRIVRKAPPDWRAGHALLRARRPHEWGDRQAVEISGPAGGPIEIDGDQGRARLAELAARLRAARAGGDGE